MLLPTSSSTSYNANNQISLSSLGYVQYDPSGNGDVTADNQNQYLYDGDERMCAVKNLYTGAMTGYIYGADGTRVSTGSISRWGSCDPVVNGYRAMEDSILGPSGSQLTETGVEANGTVVWAHTNVWLGHQLLATYDPNGIHFYLNDWTGSRRVQTDYEGVVEQTCTNLPYGDGETCGPTSNEEMYAGLDRDSESGLDHAMFRQYSSTFGRWTSPDPYGGNGYNPQSLNRYAYVNGSPLGATDQGGLSPIDAGFIYYSSAAPVEASTSFFGGLLDFLAPYAGPIGFAVEAGQVIADIGQSLGLWSFGPTFHGNTAASQSRKNVPSAPNHATGAVGAAGAAGIAGPPFVNQLPDELVGELSTMNGLGVSPMSPGAPGFAASAEQAAGQINWTLSTSGELLTTPATVGVTHAATAGGADVLGAGTAQVVTGGGETSIMEITALSGHYMKGATAAQSEAAAGAGAAAFGAFFRILFDFIPPMYLPRPYPANGGGCPVGGC